MEALLEKPQQQEKILQIEPFERQYEAWQYLLDSHTSEIGYGGAGNGGKTWIGSEFILSHAIQYPETAYLIGRKSLIDLKRTTLVTFFRVCAYYGFLNKVHYKYNQQDHTIRFYNGSVIYLMELAYKPSDPLNTFLGGLELTLAWVDESNEVNFTVIDTLSTRVGRCKNQDYGIFPKVLETFNPDKKHVYARYYKSWKEGNLPPYRAFIRALPTDNPYTPQSYIEQLKRRDKITIARLLYGSFEYDDDPSALIEYDAMLDIFTNRAVASSEKYITCDVARLGSDKTIVALWYGLQCVRLWVLSKKRTNEVADFIKRVEEKARVRRSHIAIDEDGVGGGVVDHLSGCKGFLNGSRAIDTKKSQNDNKTNYLNLRSQCYFELARLINAGEIGISDISDEVKQLIIQELEQVKQRDIDKDGPLAVIPKEKIKEILGRSPDLADTLMMRMIFELKPKKRVLAVTI